MADTLEPDRRCAIDTQLYASYIAIQSPGQAEASGLYLFQQSLAKGQLHFLGPVGMELLAYAEDGPATNGTRRIMNSFPAQRVLTPAAEDWTEAARVLLQLTNMSERLPKKMCEALETRGLFVDVLLALLCKRENCVLITADKKDHDVIHTFVKHDYMPPWPRSTARR